MTENKTMTNIKNVFNLLPVKSYITAVLGTILEISRGSKSFNIDFFRHLARFGFREILGVCSNKVKSLG